MKKFVKTGIIFLFVYLFLVSVFSYAQAQVVDPKPQLPPKPAIHNMQDDVFKILDSFENGDVDLAAVTADKHGAKLDNDQIRLIIETRPGTNIVPAIRATGAKVEGQYKNLVQILAPLGSLNELAKIPNANFIRLPLESQTSSVVSEGVVLTGADHFQTAGYKGQNVKVAVMDKGFQDYEARLGTELPPSVTTKSFYGDPGGNGDIHGNGETHGTFCAEIVYDMAPSAALYFVNWQTEVEFALAVDWLIDQKVNIISYSGDWLNAGPGNGTGPLCDVVNNAYAKGIFWAGAAGNYAQRHYEGTFTDTNANWVHEYAPGDESLDIEMTGAGWIWVFLSWNAWPTTDQDYDFVLCDPDGNWLAWSTGWQTGTQPPAEEIRYWAPTAGTYSLKINRYNARGDAFFEIYGWYNNFADHNVASSCLPIPADATGAFTVGATLWSDDTLRNFSSRGPTNDGRIKPDICGPDGVHTTYGSSYGTSVPTAHVAGAAALVKSKNTSFTASTIRSYLEANAVDLGPYGKDNFFGAGRLNLPSITSGPDVKVTPASWNYDNVAVGSYVDKVFTVSNPGNSTLSVTATSIDGAEFTIISGGAPFSLSAGAKRDIKVRFKPTSSGIKPATLSLTNNVPNKNPFNVQLGGTGTAPDIAVTPSPYDYGNVIVGSSAEKIFTVSNPGSTTLIVTATSIVGSTNFKIIGGGKFSLYPGKTRAIKVRFTSTTPQGVKTAIFRFATNVTGKNPFDVSLSGTAMTSMPDISINVEGEWNPPIYDFGPTDLNGDPPNDANFNVYNTGNATLNVSVSLTDDTYFLLWNTEFSILPGADDYFTVLFAPTSIGIKTSTLVITNNVPGKNPVTIELQGEGINDFPLLSQNYPNPFNPETWIPYRLLSSSNVKISIYEVNGGLVRTLNLGYREAGQYFTREKAAYWDGKNERGEKVSSGIYFYTMEIGKLKVTKKMTVAK